jgi:hypothetical protein
MGGQERCMQGFGGGDLGIDGEDNIKMKVIWGHGLD